MQEAMFVRCMGQYFKTGATGGTPCLIICWSQQRSTFGATIKRVRHRAAPGLQSKYCVRWARECVVQTGHHHLTCRKCNGPHVTSSVWMALHPNISRLGLCCKSDDLQFQRKRRRNAPPAVVVKFLSSTYTVLTQLIGVNTNLDCLIR